MAKPQSIRTIEAKAVTGVADVLALEADAEVLEKDAIEEVHTPDAGVDYISGLDRYLEGIPQEATSGGVEKFLYEVLDDYKGWRILVGETWELITYLQYDDPEGELVAVVAGDVVNSYNKDTTRVIR